MQTMSNFGEFVWYTFILGFCSHLPILAAYLLMVLLISGRIGRGLGVTLLIWDERPWKRFFSGFALTLFFVKLFVVGFLLAESLRAEEVGSLSHPKSDSVTRLPQAFQSKWVEPQFPMDIKPAAELPPSTRQRNRIFNYLCYMGVIFALVMVIVRLFGPFQVSQFRSRYQLRPPAFVMGVGSAVVLVSLLTCGVFSLIDCWFAQTLSQWLQRLSDIFQKVEVRETGEEWFHVASLFFVGILLLAYFVYSLDRRARYVTPVLTVCTVFALACNAYGAFVFWIWTSPLFQDVPIALILVLLATGMLWLGGQTQYKFQFPHMMSVDYSKPLALPTGIPPPKESSASSLRLEELITGHPQLVNKRLRKQLKTSSF
jgi:hypothetical protein